jgi:hypothetical protein
MYVSDFINFGKIKKRNCLTWHIPPRISLKGWPRAQGRATRSRPGWPRLPPCWPRGQLHSNADRAAMRIREATTRHDSSMGPRPGEGESLGRIADRIASDIEHQIRSGSVERGMLCGERARGGRRRTPCPRIGGPRPGHPPPMGTLGGWRSGVMRRTLAVAYRETDRTWGDRIGRSLARRSAAGGPSVLRAAQSSIVAPAAPFPT